MFTTSTRRIAAVAVMAGATFVATAIPARAHIDPNDPFPFGHACSIHFAYGDDGPLTNPIHHSVEPLVPELHSYSCQLQLTLNVLRCTVPALAILQSTTPDSC